jgi:hypothetical protein
LHPGATSRIENARRSPSLRSTMTACEGSHPPGVSIRLRAPGLPSGSPRSRSGLAAAPQHSPPACHPHQMLRCIIRSKVGP